MISGLKVYLCKSRELLKTFEELWPPRKAASSLFVRGEKCQDMTGLLKDVSAANQW